MLIPFGCRYDFAFTRILLLFFYSPSLLVIGGYVVKELLGEGGFGRVMKAWRNACTLSPPGEIVAIKLINKRSFNEITDADRVFVEIQALRDLSHKHVIKMKDVVDNPKYICFIMEYATNGELRNYVSKKTRLKEDEARQFFEQIIKGVHYCHSKNIVHRDLKLENILLDEGNQCKIADFGLSHFVVDSHATVTEGGTQAYLAPEVWNGQSKHSSPFQLDVWALGVILFGMTHGRLPFERPDRHTLEKLRTVLNQENFAFGAFSYPNYSVCSAACERAGFVFLFACLWFPSPSAAKADSSNPSRSPSQDGCPSSEAVPPAGTTIDDAVYVNRSVLRSWEPLSQGISPSSRRRTATSPTESSVPAVKRPLRPRAPENVQTSSSVPPNHMRTQKPVESGTPRASTGAGTLGPSSGHGSGASLASSARFSGGTFARKKVISQTGSTNGPILNVVAPLPAKRNAPNFQNSASGERKHSPGRLVSGTSMSRLSSGESGDSNIPVKCCTERLVIVE
uniref:Protein serine/threonine kinase n=2 Tax=Toxoplasma gondii TaxID=5811 RepID=Q27006_TOXGO|nr:protein serine/threonine kinase [Toxoplasma gondii]